MKNRKLEDLTVLGGVAVTFFSLTWLLQILHRRHELCEIVEAAALTVERNGGVPIDDGELVSR